MPVFLVPRLVIAWHIRSRDIQFSVLYYNQVLLLRFHTEIRLIPPARGGRHICRASLNDALTIEDVFRTLSNLGRDARTGRESTVGQRWQMGESRRFLCVQACSRCIASTPNLPAKPPYSVYTARSTVSRWAPAKEKFLKNYCCASVFIIVAARNVERNVYIGIDIHRQCFFNQLPHPTFSSSLTTSLRLHSVFPFDNRPYRDFS